MGCHITWVRKLDIHQLNLIFDVFQIFVSKCLVFENELTAFFFENYLAETIKVIIIEIPAKNILINLLAEFHYLLEVLWGHPVLLWVVRSHHEHLIILLPKCDEIGVFLDD